MDFPVFNGQRVFSQGVTLTTGVTITASSSANAKGSYTQIVASTSRMANWIAVCVIDNSAAADYTVDIAIGTTIIIPDLLIGCSRANQSPMVLASFPIEIPAGSQIQARCQSSTASATLAVYILLGEVGFLASAPLGRVTAYGVTTSANTRGTSIDPGATANTKGSYGQITASTSNPVRALLVIIGQQRNGTQTTCRWQIDVARGAAGSEQIILADLPMQSNTTSDQMIPTVFGPFFFDIPAATRLSARAACSITDATDRLFDIALYGID